MSLRGVTTRRTALSALFPSFNFRYSLTLKSLSSGIKRPEREADYSRQECLALYLHSAIRLHGFVRKRKDDFAVTVFEYTYRNI
jgi:hypothetical protein